MLNDPPRRRLGLFSEDDIYDANLGGLVGGLEDWLTGGPPDAPRLCTTTTPAFSRRLNTGFQETPVLATSRLWKGSS